MVLLVLPFLRSNRSGRAPGVVIIWHHESLAPSELNEAFGSSRRIYDVAEECETLL